VSEGERGEEGASLDSRILAEATAVGAWVKNFSRGEGRGTRTGAARLSRGRERVGRTCELLTSQAEPLRSRYARGGGAG
jgi:hypothetical protein